MALDIFILGAAKPAVGENPVALQKIGHATTVIDWQLDSFTGLEYGKINFLGGYHIDDIIHHCPQINYVLIKDWQHKSVLNTLLQGPLTGKSALITYADTIFRQHVIKELAASEADLSIAIDINYQHRFSTRSATDLAIAEIIIPTQGKFKGCKAEFTGLIHCKPHITNIISKLSCQDVGKNLLDLISYLQKAGHKLEFIDVGNNWAELNEPADIARFILGNKADSLARLAPMVRNSHIGKQISFSVKDWLGNERHILNKISLAFPKTPVAIRSSSSSEDGWIKSGAGKYTSILDIDSQSIPNLTVAINKVIASYGSHLDRKYDQVLVQEFIQDVRCAGVVFTCSLETGAPYYIFNFDDNSGVTNSITSGFYSDSRTIILQHSRPEQLDEIEQKLSAVLDAVSEIRQLVAFDKLDIEFAIDSKDRVHTFQVRPITIDHRAYESVSHLFEKQLRSSIGLFKSSQAASPFVCGESTCFSNMSDWNPAEIIGTSPKPLAFSLYTKLITNDIWAKQRSEFGYRDIRPQPLIISFCGKPYVDLRASFNTFIPKSLDDKLASKLVAAYLSNLKSNPKYHDKIEFDVALTIWTPSFKDDAKNRLLKHSITEVEISSLEDKLKSITCRAVVNLEKDVASITKLEKRREKLILSKLSSLDKAYALLDDCQRFGTLAFAHAARHGFIATSFLKSFQREGMLTLKQFDQFMLSINTVVSDIQADQLELVNGNIGMEGLVARYGHLRPGTYDATAQAYWEDPQLYLTGSKRKKTNKSTMPLVLSKTQERQVSLAIREVGLQLSVTDFFDYLKRAIISREAVKLAFTHNLSLALDYIIDFGKGIGISRENIVYLNYHNLTSLKLGTLAHHQLATIIGESAKQDKLNKMFELPGFICEANDFYCFEKHSAQANFITNKQVTAKIMALRTGGTSDVSGRIILIQQADPGYDWLFSYNIAGLITQHGGANSHMAIRTAELGIPAAIGVGDKIYNKLLSSDKVKLDCNNNNIVIII
ncbi:PEP-utilizing enzyme [Candidatus Pseudothioglobus sp. Uisw_086]|uniref:PEP-utilizing enzyme n=1 Tax=Candidatus Pseudothioglobus sp. Uisw_086 TaxID=3230998 RepID=UPI003A87D809